MRVVQVYAQEDNQIRGFHKISAECMHKNMWLATLWGIFWPLMRVVSGVAATIVLWLGGRQVLQGTMSLGEFVAFNGYLGMLTWPLMAIGYVVNQYQRGTAALSRIGEVLDAESSPRYHVPIFAHQACASEMAIEFWTGRGSSRMAPPIPPMTVPIRIGDLKASTPLPNVSTP